MGKKLLVGKYNFLSDTYRDDNGYFLMGPEEQASCVLNKQIEFLGKERLKEALLAVWNLIRPDPDQVHLGMFEDSQ